MPNSLNIANNWCFWQYLWLSSIQDHRLSTHPSKGRLSLGRQHVACYVIWTALLSAVALRTLYFSHFKLFCFPNVIGLVQWIVRFVMRTEPKASYKQFNTVSIVTPLVIILSYFILSIVRCKKVSDITFTFNHLADFNGTSIYQKCSEFAFTILK